MNARAAAGRPFFFAVDFLAHKALFQEGAEGIIEFSFPNGQSGRTSLVPSILPSITPHPIPLELYARGFKRVQKALHYGDSFLLNYTVRTPVDLSCSLEELYPQIPAPYRLHVPGRFLCFSPEPFVRISREGRISSFPMKGTISLATPNAASALLHDPKELAEHYTIVDLIRNDLSRVATTVRVERFRYLEEINTRRGKILQTSSEIAGHLQPDWPSHIGDTILALLPAGSITGAPKEATVRTILEAETAPRGFYTGVAGYFDGSYLESTVLIRYIEQQGDAFYFHSGGGITTQSTCEGEYQEMLDKIYLPTHL